MSSVMKKRAKNPVAVPFPLSNDEGSFAFDNEFRPYLYWPPAIVMVTLAVTSYLIGMYFAS